MAKEGNAEEAKRIHKDILAKFPKNKRAQQGLAASSKPQRLPNRQEPPQDTINQLLNLYNQGHLSDALEKAQALAQQYPEGLRSGIFLEEFLLILANWIRPSVHSKEF